MLSADIPTEVVDQVIENVDDVNKKNTLLASRLVAKSWSYTSLECLFLDLGFKDWNDVHHFITILSASTTFPDLIRSKRIALNNPTAIDDKTTSALLDLMAAVHLPQSLAIHVTTGGIADILKVVGQGWANLAQVTLSGGVHPPTALFALASLHRLQSLTLQDFQLEDMEEGVEGTPATQFSFPTSITKLSLDRSSTLWPFFRTHILPGGGLANIDELCIRAQFSYEEEGVWAMVQCFRKLRGIRTLKLEPVYDANTPRLIQDMKGIFYGTQGFPLVRIRGLRRLHLRLANAPAELALNCIGMYGLQLPAANVGTSVEVDVPRSVELWDNSDPSAHFRQFLEEAQGGPNDVASNVRALLAVRGFPGTLPAEVAVSGSAVVCGYPVVFMASDGEEAGM